MSNPELEITRDEFLEKYGNVAVTFSSYYKYEFCFVGTLPDGKTLTCWKGGGDVDDIYRFEVNNNPTSVDSILPNEGVIKDGDSLVEWF